ncbi:MAG: tRNA 2-thiouridine(34) synthase MnmA [Gammaproteobacteria bacterium]
MPRSGAEAALPAGFAERHGDPHVVVAMSGGVDSSVAAMLVKRAGLRCSALFMKNWNEPTDGGACHWEDDVADALAVCERLGIEINTIDLSAAYWDEVFDDFLTEYRRGRTPNPDVLCNREIKFKAFLEAARELGADLIATGHYVALGREGDAARLLRGADPGKDQSYFLYTLGQVQLEASLFPLGELTKPAVRALAREAGLATHEKKDSTGICFIGERRFREFLGRYVPATPGAIVTVDGRTIGEHAGAVFYTLGQRQGLGIGGVAGADQAPWYVVDKDLASNTLVVAQGHDHPALLSSALTAGQVCWVADRPPPLPLAATAKVRYRQPDQPCRVSEGARPGTVVVHFEQPQRAVTPGQSVVFYDGRECLGGGIIEARA